MSGKPIIVDLRATLPAAVPVQGPDRPLCLPFTVGGAHESGRSQFLGRSPTQLAVEPLWSHCELSGVTSADGTFLWAVGEALSAEGQPDAAHWPYNPLLGSGTEPRPSTVGPPPWRTASIREIALARDGVEPQLSAELLAGRAVVLVVELTDEFDNAAVDGQIAVPPVTVAAGGYHAVLALGLRRDVASSDLLIRNTWGARWGNRGWGWLPTRYLVDFGHQAAVIDAASLSAEPV